MLGPACVVSLGLIAPAAWGACGGRMCSCIAAEDLALAVSAADAVFLGTVDSVDDDLDPMNVVTAASADYAISGRSIRFRTLASCKGPATAILEVRTGATDAECGFPFEPRGTYLVFAREDGGTLMTSLCSRTARAQDASGDLVELGVPMPADRL